MFVDLNTLLNWTELSDVMRRRTGGYNAGSRTDSGENANGSAAAAAACAIPVQLSHKLVVVTDTIAADANWLLSHFVSLYVRCDPTSHVVLVGLNQSRFHYTQVAKKLMLKLDKLQPQRFSYIDGMSDLGAMCAVDNAAAVGGSGATTATATTTSDGASAVDALFKRVLLKLLAADFEPAVLASMSVEVMQASLISAASSADGGGDGDRGAARLACSVPTCLIVDCLDVLVPFVPSPKAVLVFVRRLHALVMSLHPRSSVVVLKHSDCDDTDAICKALAYSSDLLFETCALSSGYSADVSGRLAVSDNTGAPCTVPRVCHYRTRESAVSIFSVGQSV